MAYSMQQNRRTKGYPFVMFMSINMTKGYPFVMFMSINMMP